VRVHGVSLAAGLGAATVARAAAIVLGGERRARATASVTFLSAQRMRALNRRAFGRDHATDVIAFGLPHDDQLVADVYVCPAVARREARAHALPIREELIRLVVHGTLHATGWDHGEGPRRERSPMWRRQETYVRRILGIA
jgi:probable rRNA maturation factor